MHNDMIRKMLLAIIIGFALTFTTCIFSRQSTMRIFNDCVGTCAMWVSRDVDVVVRGFPFVVTTTETESTDNEGVGISIKGLFGNWLLYSLVAYGALLLWRPKYLAPPRSPRS